MSCLEDEAGRWACPHLSPVVSPGLWLFILGPHSSYSMWVWVDFWKLRIHRRCLYYYNEVKVTNFPVRQWSLSMLLKISCVYFVGSWFLPFSVACPNHCLSQNTECVAADLPCTPTSLPCGPSTAAFLSLSPWVRDSVPRILSLYFLGLPSNSGTVQPQTISSIKDASGKNIFNIISWLTVKLHIKN